MPAKLERCVRSLIAKGHSEDSAWAICTASQKNEMVIENVEEIEEIELVHSYREISPLKKFNNDKEFKVYTIHFKEGVKVIVGPLAKEEDIGYGETAKKAIRGFLFEAKKWDETKIDEFLTEEWKVEKIEETKRTECLEKKYYQLDVDSKLVEGNFQFDFTISDKYQEDDDWFYIMGQANVEEFSRNGPFLITKDSFRNSTEEYLENPKIFFQHQQYAGWLFPSEKDETAYSIGEAVEAGVNEIGPWIVSKISKNPNITPQAVQDRIKAGLIHTFSVGIIALSEEYVCANKNACFLLIDKISWLETSVVEIPASRHSQFKLIQNLEPGSRFSQFVDRSYDLTKFGLGHIPKGPGPVEVKNEAVGEPETKDDPPEEPEIEVKEEMTEEKEIEVKALQQDFSKLEEGYKKQLEMAESEKEKVLKEKAELEAYKKELEEKNKEMERAIKDRQITQDIAFLVGNGNILPVEQEGWKNHLSTLTEEQYAEAKKLLESRKVLDMGESTPAQESTRDGEASKPLQFAHHSQSLSPQEKREKLAQSLVFRRD